MNANRMCTRLTTLAAATVLCCAPALAQNGTPETNPAGQSSSPSTGMNGNMQDSNGKMGHGKMCNMGGSASMQDKMFLKKAAAGSEAEIQLGQLALQKSSNDQVKQFAQKMVDDHTKLNDQMKPVAQQLNVDLPTEPMAKDKAVMTKLQGMSGADFDKAYMRDMVKDHTEDLKEFKKEAASGKDPQVKSAAEQGSDVIAGHLKMAKQVATSVGAGNAQSASADLGAKSSSK